MTSTPPSRGIFFVLVGPGGAGKDTLMQRLLARFANTPHRLSRLVTATTRPPRAQERDGVDYHFKTQAGFEEMIANDALIEYTPVTKGNFYGVPRASVEDKITQGEHVIGHVDVLGARIIKAQYPNDTVLIFVTVGGTPDQQLSELKRRMEQRATGSDRPEIIAERVERARTLEIPFAQECDIVIINDDIDTAEQQLYDAMLQVIHQRIATQQP